MMKRLLSLALSLVLVLGLFAGLAGSASADDEIGQIFGRYLTGDKIEEFFDGDSLKHGMVGKTKDTYVQYDIYRVDSEKLKELKADTSVIEQNELFQRLRERYPDFNLNGQDLLTDLTFDLVDGQEYYAIKFYGYGDGEMKDFALKRELEWSGAVQLNDGTVVQNMDDKIIALYVEGNRKGSTFYTGVTSIGEKAFFGMDGLMLAYLGETVKSIGEKAFETCDQLSAINFPSALESIGRRAFYACDYLTFARLTSCSKLKEIPERAFCTCSHLTEIALPNSITSIGNFAFAWDHTLGTNQFSLPSNLKTIGTGAFAFCTHLGIVNDIAIPANTTNIGNWAFTCCFDLGRSAGGIDIYPGRAGEALPLTIGTGAFAGCSSLEKINFPNRVAFINDYAFAACDKLERVSFGDRDGTETLHIRSIGDRAFDSLEDTGLSALRTIAAVYNEVDSGEPEEGYSNAAAAGLSDKVYDLSGVTPLKYAAFGGFPPSKEASGGVIEASSNKHSFPRTVVIWYPNLNYNSSAFSEWRDIVGNNNPPKNPQNTWFGYTCEPVWGGHFHEYGDPLIVPRTCTQDGQEIYTCHVWQDGKECGHVETVITEKATGHDSEMLDSEAPDCTHTGVAWYECSNEWCDKHIYSETLPALGHDHENLTDSKAPTCLEPGYIKGICSRCGESFEEVIPAKGHNIASMDLIQAPTCTEEGIYQGDCIDCHRRSVRQTVPALGHEWNEVVITPASETTDGMMLRICLRCGETEKVVIEKTMHVHHYVETVVPPTCTKEGYTIYKCSCGDEYTDNYIPAGHKWDSGVVTVQPGASTEGRIKYTCTVCGQYRYDKIPATGLAFVDVPDGEWFTGPVSWAVTHKPVITNGTDATHFSPYADCTRAQAVTFLWRAAGEPDVSGIVNQFSDVHAGDYFYKAVLWAVKNGITNGVDASHFDPEGVCTRAHIVTFLWRWKGEPGVNSTAIPFSDVPRGEWFTTAVLWAAENGITQGMGDGTFGTTSNCTRGHIVTFLQRADNLK